MRLVMMGTGRFALPALSALYESRHEVVGLFTQPDRTGRGHHRHQNPMKALAVEHGTPVFQPNRVNTPEPIADLRGLNADLCVVAAYGQILSAELIETPRLGAINLHASLLPKYRGAAPIHYAILHGETETGITIFQIEPKLDAGPIFGMVSTEIGPKETTGDLEARLAELAAPLTLSVIDGLAAGTLEPIVQDSAEVTRAPSMRKSFGQIDWTKSTQQVLCHIRAMQPWPKPFTFLTQDDHDPVRLIILDAEPDSPDDNPELDSLCEPGTVAFADGASFSVRAGDGAVRIVTLQPEGKRPMSTADFLHGHAVHPGDRLTE